MILFLNFSLWRIMFLSVIFAFALNELADYVYQNIHSNQIILIDGCLDCTGNKDISIQIKDIEVII